MPVSVIGFVLIGGIFFNLLGRCVIRLDAEEGSIFSGIGSLGITRRFSTQSLKIVGTEITVKSKKGRKIELSGYGKMRDVWLAFAIRKILARQMN